MHLRRFGRRLGSALIDNDVDDLAAMMTYYEVFAVFPMVLFVLSLTLLVLPAEMIAGVAASVGRALPHDVGALLEAQVGRTRLATEPHVAIITGVLTLWGASRGTAALTVALNRVFGVTESRPWWQRQLLAIGVTLGIAVLIVLALALLVFGPSMARWLGAALVMTAVWSLLYRLLPDRSVALHVITPGAITGVVLWIAVSRAAAYFLTYVADFEATYGALAGALTVLFWLWLSNLALLTGAALSEALSREPSRSPSAGAREKARNLRAQAGRDARPAPAPRHEM